MGTMLRAREQWHLPANIDIGDNGVPEFESILGRCLCHFSNRASDV